MRYTVNISFYGSNESIVDKCRTKSDADEWRGMIDDTVKKALIKDNASGKIEWLKNDYRLPT